MIKNSLASLSNSLFRRYFMGMVISRAGNWMQDVAQGWYVLQTTGSGTAVGEILAIEYVPLLIFGVYGGSIVDRFSRRKLVISTQLILGVLAIALGLVTAHHADVSWMYVLALLRGLVNCIALPAASAFLSEIVPGEQIRSAVSLNGVGFNTARVVGPAIATALISAYGISTCFYVNAVTFFAFVALLKNVKPIRHLEEPEPTKKSVLQGLHYVWNKPELRAGIVIMLAVGTFLYNSQIFLPLIDRSFYGNHINIYAVMLVVYAAGNVIAAFLGAAGKPPTNRMLLNGTALYIALVAIEAIAAPNHYLGWLVLFAWGMASGNFNSRINTCIQLHSSDAMKGRTMALWNVVVWGTTAIGAPIVGFIAQHYGPRASLLFAACSTTVFLAYAFSILRERLTMAPQLASADN